MWGYSDIRIPSLQSKMPEYVMNGGRTHFWHLDGVGENLLVYCQMPVLPLHLHDVEPWPCRHFSLFGAIFWIARDYYSRMASTFK